VDPVFGRYGSDPHPYDPLLNGLLAGPPYERAVARNVRHDGRVSPERERLFDLSFEDRRSGQDLLDALSAYKKRNRRLRQPDFHHPEINGENFRTGRTDGGDEIHKDVLLARVLELSGLGTVVEDHGRAGRPEFRTFRDFAGGPPEEFDAWLDREIERQTPDVFMTALLESINESRRRRPFHPSWVTYWDRMEPYLREPAHRWLEAVGIHRETEGRWVAILRYVVRDAGKLVRPTVLEAGPAPEHFPTPTRSLAGHPMDLGQPEWDEELLPELLHRQIDHDPESHWRQPGSYLARTERATSGELKRQRREHLRRLQNLYADDVVDWQPI